MILSQGSFDDQVKEGASLWLFKGAKSGLCRSTREKESKRESLSLSSRLWIVDVEVERIDRGG